MKKYLIFAVLIILGVIITLGYAWNEGGNAIAAWMGVIYSAVVAAFVALFENQALSRAWNKIGIDVAIIIGSSILTAICYSLV